MGDGNIDDKKAGQAEQSKAPDADKKPSAWYLSLPDGLKDNPNITKFADVAALAKGYDEVSRKVGQKGFPALPEGATPEQKEAYKALRRGDAIKTPDDYSFGRGEADAQLDALKKTLFGAGADDALASDVLSALQADFRAQEQSMEAYAAKVYSADADRLRAEWGEDYAVNVKANEILLKKHPQAAEILQGLGVDKRYAVAKMLHDLNMQSGDAQVKFSAACGKSIDDRISAITSSDAYKQTWHEKHQEAVLARAELILEKSRRGL